MAKLIIVMGTAASGKTHFIEENFSFMDYKHISIGQIQRESKTDEEVDAMGFHEYFDYLAECNEKAKVDMTEALKAGENVILEHTLYKAKRRIVYVEAARQATTEPIDIYVMMPSRDRLRENLKLYKPGGETFLDRFLDEMSQIEYPNPAEGFDKIYSVTDGEIRESIVSEDVVLVDRAKEELAKEAEEIKQRQEKGEELSERQKLIKGLQYKPFWHICEACGKKEFMTAEAAFIKGWDYPPKMGKFGVIGPRTCGDCGIEQTVWWNIVKSGEDMKPAEDKDSADDVTIKMQKLDSSHTEMDTMTEEHKREVIMRIAREPYSLLEGEKN